MNNVSLVDGHIDEPKMTDEEIIEALECCIKWKDGEDCVGCPAKNKGECCFTTLRRASLDLINRLKAQNKEFDEKIVMQMGLIEYQKAEIERLNKILENRGEICKLCEGKYTEKIKRAKTEAIKEFAERLKECRVIQTANISGYIDNLVKEMVGD